MLRTAFDKLRLSGICVMPHFHTPLRLYLSKPMRRARPI